MAGGRVRFRAGGEAGRPDRRGAGQKFPSIWGILVTATGPGDGALGWGAGGGQFPTERRPARNHIPAFSQHSRPLPGSVGVWRAVSMAPPHPDSAARARPGKGDAGRPWVPPTTKPKSGSPPADRRPNGPIFGFSPSGMPAWCSPPGFGGVAGVAAGGIGADRSGTGGPAGAVAAFAVDSSCRDPRSRLERPSRGGRSGVGGRIGPVCASPAPNREGGPAVNGAPGVPAAAQDGRNGVPTVEDTLETPHGGSAALNRGAGAVLWHWAGGADRPG